MNRLIIIGNGFDLAHGLKTSYHDFILDYLKKSLINCINSGRFDLSGTKFRRVDGYYTDDLLEIILNQKYSNIKYEELINKINTITDCIDFIKNYFEFNYKFILLEKSIVKLCEFNWVDIETEYFNLLLETKNSSKTHLIKKNVIILNNQLDYLKEKLIEYLKEQQYNFTNSFIKNQLVGCFTEVIHPHEIVTTLLENDERPENLFFLNFNYTNTFEAYFDSCRKIIPSEFDYIHGALGGAHGQPIFGFGDELDKNYLEFEDEKNNELFKHIKSFEYLKNKNYYRLIRFIESGDYQVQIYGHSCGLSDRTMLNQIFEHENCKSIKIFYHQKEDGTNDYTEKTYEISRHFKDKGMMRKKVVPLDYSKAMPQPKL